jgi:hypothetical protein
LHLLDLNLELFLHLNPVFFHSVSPIESLVSCIRTDKKNMFQALLNHGKAYAIKRAIASSADIGISLFGCPTGLDSTCCLPKKKKDL